MATKIAGFDVFELVGRGGMGSVYRALDPLIGRTVAIKVIRLVGYNNQEEAAYLKERLFKEARAAGSLSHPGIATVYQAGSEEDVAFIAMEYIDGPTLEAKLALGQRSDHRDLLRTMRDTAAALDYAHQHGIIHRDIKPSNIMSTAAGLTKVTDFGIAKTMLGHTHTQEGQLLGTPFYMSPEQIQGKRLDGRSDQFALAVVAYEAFTGNRPFVADSVTNLCYQIVHSEPICPNDLDCNLPFDALQAFKRALKKDPSKRFSTCSEFIAQLDAALAATPPNQVAETVKPQPAQSAPPRRRQPSYRATRLVAAALLLFAFAVAGWYLYPPLLQPQLQPPATHSPTPPSPPNPSQVTHAVAPEAPHSTYKLNSHKTRLPPPPPTLLPDVTASPNNEVPAVTTSVTGYILWTGRINKGDLLDISGELPSTGDATGSLPDPPFTLEVFPVANAAGVLTAYTTDRSYAKPVVTTLGGVAVQLVWDPRHANDVSLWETPTATNFWKKLTLRVNVATLEGCLVKWTKRAS